MQHAKTLLQIPAEHGLGMQEDTIHAALHGTTSGVTWMRICGLTDRNGKKLKIRIEIRIWGVVHIFLFTYCMTYVYIFDLCLHLRIVFHLCYVQCCLFFSLQTAMSMFANKEVIL